MTTGLRKIEPLPRPEKVATVSAVNNLPEFSFVAPEQLLIEESYQRSISKSGRNNILHMVQNWNWAHMKPPVVVRAAQPDRFYVIDGQHTAVAAVTHGGIKKLPVMIVRADSVQERAQAFMGQNERRVSLSLMNKHAARVAAGDDIALRIEQSCANARCAIVGGAAFKMGKQYQVGDVFAISSMVSVVKAKGVAGLTRLLKTLVMAQRGPVLAMEIKALAELLFKIEVAKYRTMEQIALVIMECDPDEWEATAKRINKGWADKGHVERQRPLFKIVAELWAARLDKLPGTVSHVRGDR